MYVPYKALNVFLAKYPEETHEIVYADTRNEAKQKLIDGISKTDGELAHDDSLEYIDLGARRLKCCDGLSDEPLSLIAETAMKQDNWSWNMDCVDYTADDIADPESLAEFKALFDE